MSRSRRIAVAACVVAAALGCGAPTAGATWAVPVGVGSAGQAAAGPRPAAPATAAASCVVARTSGGARSDSVRITWPAAANATAYTLRVRYTSGSGPWSSWATVTDHLAATTYLDTNSAPSSLTFQYQVFGRRGTDWYSATARDTGTVSFSNGVCS